MRLALYLFLVLVSLPCFSFTHNHVIKAAVAEGFANGLHAKYLRYIAKEMGMELALYTMPFARRVQEIRNGNLDIIVGIQRTEDREDEFVYIEPYYESLSYRFFTLKEHQHKFQSFDDLKGRMVGVNKHSKYFPQFNNSEEILKVDVVSLEQNIKLLAKKRIDALIHYEESTIPTLKKMGLSEYIVKTPYQPEHSNKHYVAISHKSPLIHHKSELKKIIRLGVENKDLLNIRLQHYTNKQ